MVSPPSTDTPVITLQALNIGSSVCHGNPGFEGYETFLIYPG